MTYWLVLQFAHQLAVLVPTSYGTANPASIVCRDTSIPSTRMLAKMRKYLSLPIFTSSI